jgi:ribosome-binding factor A
MATYRVERIRRTIHEIASQVLLQELRDPRLGFITVTDVKLSPDIEHAQILVSVMGSDIDKRTTMKGLTDARGYVQKAIAGRLHTRTTPHIEFVLDTSIDKAIAFTEILKTIERERAEHEVAPPASPEAKPEEEEVEKDEEEKKAGE